jgi:hypothetical protein
MQEGLPPELGSPFPPEGGGMISGRRIEGALELAFGFAELFEVLQIMIDADQKMAICTLRC